MGARPHRVDQHSKSVQTKHTYTHKHTHTYTHTDKHKYTHESIHTHTHLWQANIPLLDGVLKTVAECPRQQQVGGLAYHVIYLCRTTRTQTHTTYNYIVYHCRATHTHTHTQHIITLCTFAEVHTNTHHNISYNVPL